MARNALVLFLFLIAFSVNHSLSTPLADNLVKQTHRISVYELRRGNMSAKFTNWGATLISLFLPDKHGKLGDVVLGYDHLKEYLNDTAYFGAVVGRVANRIGNAQFKLNGIRYKTVANEGHNTLHGGKRGFSDVAWKVVKYHNEGPTPYLVFGYASSDGEQGFPGHLFVTVSYALTSNNGLTVLMKGKTKNKATPVNLAQHSYWNLGGHNSGDILSEEVQIFGSHYTPVDSKLIPTGEVVPVKGTPYDFLNPHTIKSTISQLSKGYDINYAVDGPMHEMRRVAIVTDWKSGRRMQLFANQPGLQFYTGNYLKSVKGKHGAVYQAHAGLCLETQGYPDAVNKPKFPSQILNPGQSYRHLMLYKFSIVS